MAYSDTIPLVRGDTRPILTFTVRDSNKAAAGKTLDPNNPATWAVIDLTGASGLFRMRQIGSSVVVAALTCAITDPTNGVIGVAFTTGALALAGQFEGELEITFADGGIQTVVDLVKFKVRDSFD